MFSKLDLKMMSDEFSKRVDEPRDTSLEVNDNAMTEQILDKEEPALAECDEMMEAILANINSTPIGRVLRRISELPEIRKRKVLNLRRQLTEGNYDVTDRLDCALDRVLEDIMA